MSLPIAFLLGLLVIVGHRELGSVLPGEGTVDWLVFAGMVLLVPAILAQWARLATERALRTGRPLGNVPFVSLRLSRLAVPVVLHVLFAYGCYGDWVDRMAPTSHGLRILLCAAPLYAVELPRLVLAAMTQALLEGGLASEQRTPMTPAMLPRWRDAWPLIRLRLGWPLLALLPIVMLAGAVQLLSLNREAYVYVYATSLGLTAATCGFLIVVAMLLPIWFRFAFGATRRLPETVGENLRATARLLGFSPKRVLALPTGMRAINAMMVGPLPFGRVLCMTDALMKELDSLSLSGVLAHEIGHARRGHPGILMVLAVLLPMLLLVPLRMVDVESLDVVWQSAGMLLAMITIWTAIRRLARRFEHEADVASVIALGAGPCSQALQTVSRMAMPPSRRLFSRLMSVHPDESERLRVMRRYETEPPFREQFDARGRRLRRWLGVALLLALGVASWSWWADWKYERLLTSFYTGDYVACRNVLDESAHVPSRWQQSFSRIGEQTAAALELAPGTRHWESAKAALDPTAWQRGAQVLLADGPAAAQPWFAVALAVMDEPSTVQLAISEYCDAAKNEDPDTMVRAAAIVRRLGAPTALRPVFAASM